MPVLQILSPRTITKPFSPPDAHEIYACISPEITKFMTWEPPASYSDFRTVWRAWLAPGDPQTDLHLVVRDRKDSRFLGCVGLHSLRTKIPELGIWLRRDAHGMGFGGEVIGAVVAWASRQFTVECFEYPVAEENVASRRIAESLGGSTIGRRDNPKYRAIVYHIPSAVEQTELP
ncbi:GNAT family N-acetyltransferase [Mesorhizobium sp. 1B3]|uniref:GNAT family N-acetyltransferase n=1 Tax=Mesorhizobium sp. 1B3 TaxID=3243599 RepID=UPI003D97474D